MSTSDDLQEQFAGQVAAAGNPTPLLAFLEFGIDVDLDQRHSTQLRGATNRMAQLKGTIMSTNT
ncbi:MAG: hypothetical protein ACREHD_00225, partial [Pirellulales bacterium]